MPIVVIVALLAYFQLGMIRRGTSKLFYLMAMALPSESTCSIRLSGTLVNTDFQLLLIVTNTSCKSKCIFLAPTTQLTHLKSQHHSIVTQRNLRNLCNLCNSTQSTQLIISFKRFISSITFAHVRMSEVLV